MRKDNIDFIPTEYDSQLVEEYAEQLRAISLD